MVGFLEFVEIFTGTAIAPFTDTDSGMFVRLDGSLDLANRLEVLSVATHCHTETMLGEGNIDEQIIADGIIILGGRGSQRVRSEP